MNGILVTGGLGFIGSHLIRFLLSSECYSESHVFNVDYMGYGSNSANIERSIMENSRYTFLNTDINDIDKINGLGKDIDVIVNVAAETHVDRSISNPTNFVHSNFNGTFSLLEYARRKDIIKYIQISTDEVYGEARNNYSFKEKDILNPSNPYSSTKASADLLVNSYFRTYGLKTSITRCTNNFGPYQFPEKLIPRTILRTLLRLAVLVYGNGNQVRDWIYVQDHVSAVDTVIRNGSPGVIYNISASNLMTNMDIIDRISGLVKAKSGISSEISFVEDRPGHDYRYSLDSTKIRTELGWKPNTSLDYALEKTVAWYLANKEWWQNMVDPFVTDPYPWRRDW